MMRGILERKPDGGFFVGGSKVVKIPDALIKKLGGAVGKDVVVCGKHLPGMVFVSSVEVVGEKKVGVKAEKKEDKKKK